MITVDERLVRLLIRHFHGHVARLDERKVAGGPRVKLAATLLSVASKERQLSSGEAQELAAHIARRDRYAQLLTELKTVAPDIVSYKGAATGSYYPEGVVRYYNDLDVTAPSHECFAACATALIENGFKVDKASFFVIDGEPHYHVGFWRKCQGDDTVTSHASFDYVMTDYVEVSTYSLVGSPKGIRPKALDLIAEYGQAVTCLLKVLNERLEQPFRARDLLDAVLIAEHLSSDEVVRLQYAVRHLQMGPEAKELVALARAILCADLTWLLPARDHRLVKSRRKLVVASQYADLRLLGYWINRGGFFDADLQPRWRGALLSASLIKAAQRGRRLYGIPIGEKYSVRPLIERGWPLRFTCSGGLFRLQASSDGR